MQCIFLKNNSHLIYFQVPFTHVAQVKRIQLDLSLVHAFVVILDAQPDEQKRSFIKNGQMTCVPNGCFSASFRLHLVQNLRGCLNFNNCLFSHRKKSVLLHTVTM